MSDTPDVIQSTTNVGAAQSYVEGEFGGPTTESESVYTVSLPNVIVISQNNPDRVGLTIINLGANSLFVALDDSVSSSRGIYLEPNGGSLSLTVVNDQMLPTRKWYAAVDNGNTTIFVIEVFRYALTS